MWTYTLLPQIINMSLTGAIVIIFVLIAREFMKKSPKIFSYALWAVVLFRLLCPVSFTAPFSFLSLTDAPVRSNDTIEYIPTNIVHAENPKVDLPIGIISDAINERLPQGEEQLRADPLEGPMYLATLVWLIGVGGMVIYAVAAYVDLRLKLIGAVKLYDNVYLCDNVSSPFVIGFIIPKIYLPTSLNERERLLVTMHEQMHIKRADHIFKTVAFIALTIHWFNPLVWLAFILASKDMEMACDEAVIRSLNNCNADTLKILGENAKADYSQALLNLATGRKIIAGTPLAFGEGDTKVRIINLMRYKSPKLWTVIVLILVTAVLSLGFALNPKPDPKKVEREYTGTNSFSYLDPDNPAYEIGINSYDMIVFKDPNAAFEAAVDDYFKGIYVLKNAYKLDTISKSYYKDYKKYGAQHMTADPNVNEQMLSLSKFLDIYENSFETVHAITANATLAYEKMKSDRQSFLRDYLLHNGEFAVVGKNIAARIGDFYETEADIKQLGTPNSTFVNYDIGIDEGDYNKTLEYDGCTLRMYYSALKKKYTLSRIDITAGDYETHRGISIGSTMDEVLEAYPEIASRASEMRTKYVWYCQDYDDPYSNIITFFFDDDMKVNRMIYEHQKVTLRQKLITSDSLTIASGHNSITITPNADKDDILWIELDANDDTVPFHVYDVENREHYAFFSIHDAETGEKLDFFTPSGLSPQTYLFQNAKSGGRYIVTMTTGFGLDVNLVEMIAPDTKQPEPAVVLEDEISLVYRFGVIVP